MKTLIKYRYLAYTIVFLLILLLGFMHSIELVILLLLGVGYFLIFYLNKEWEDEDKSKS